MQFTNKHKLVLFFILLIMGSKAFAQGYGYYPPSYGYAFPPQYHYPVPPPAYGYPYYPSARFYPAPQEAAIPPAAPPVKKTNKPEIQSVTKRTGKKPKSEVTLSSSNKKQKFIDLLLPHIDRENQMILADRQWLKALSFKVQSQSALSVNDGKKLRLIGKAYKVSMDSKSTKEFIDQLLKRVDIIPASLTLAQAANETGWGTSRFAKEAHNYFGIWTYEADKGLKPKNRETDKKHYVRKFDSPAESVTFYMKLLNTHPAYKELRDIRSSLRRENSHISGIQLAQGLEKYSAKGNEYIKLITLLITQNQWAQLDTGLQTASS